ncbi:MerR family transcriptional regulator [Iamia sp.]|uniref:MerR family transcriptional regulator n=1 Tax=Iamia sp. TaxID=2722710 RepID=UPI002BDCBEC5|nr:MerR family transcriptional regulator [Iamia sp.]HXH57395.1 MerR family transcriptional regulator [Iamia sp.]
MTAIETAPSTGTERAEATAALAIGEVAERTSTTVDTLRYYERIGLIEVGRDAGGRRAYTDHDVRRVVFLTRMRQSEMPIRDLQRYVELVNEGPHTAPERLALMESHREAVRRRQTELAAALAVIDFKITAYGGTCGA